MPEYTAEMRDECGDERTVTVRADDDADAEEVCIEEVVGWVMGSNWGEDGVVVRVHYRLKDGEGRVVSSGHMRVEASRITMPDTEDDTCTS